MAYQGEYVVKLFDRSGNHRFSVSRDDLKECVRELQLYADGWRNAIADGETAVLEAAE